ncbi:hypothetical protein PQ455_16725 [Sphingomonas naphthae]|uniref:Uncharacterized protein n=1 Tax=Sphingomonas naphthae TaxID=1813468 RepID=A0ABY7TKD5_9SPHN|nr:hypothetical protein [Sphingomonas naphthae]WCT73241.1 hypothetical protein PQ455_16725 [Sphingomonas naphthae]
MPATTTGQIEPATLYLGNRPALLIADETTLNTELADIDNMYDGGIVILGRSPRHWIKAVRKSDLWSVSFRAGPFWTLSGFAAGETDYSSRMVERSRVSGSRLKAALTAPPPENALTAKDVAGLFVAYLLGTKFPIPPGIGGA